MNMFKCYKGFTLIELMIVVGIIGLLAAIAVPNYQEYIAKGRQVDAQSELLSLANALERNFTVTGRYDFMPDPDNPGATIATTIVGVYGTTTVGTPAYYNLSFVLGTCTDDGEHIPLAATAFRLYAIPAGIQTGDRCGCMTINSRGQRTAEDNGCWR